MLFKKKCPICGAKNSKERTVCIECGAPFALGQVEGQLARVSTEGETKKREGVEEVLREKAEGVDLENLKGALASTPASRVALYRSGLRALIGAGGQWSYIIFDCKERPECYAQFAVEPDGPELIGEVSGESVCERGHGILLSAGFKAPSKSTPNYSQNFKNPQSRALAELVERAFREVLDSPDSYTAHVADALYQ